MSSVATRAPAPVRPHAPPIWPIAVAVAAVLVVFGTTWASEGLGAEGLTLLNRFLARLSFVLFVPVYAASSLLVLAPGRLTRALVRGRRRLGLAYAFVMASHAVAILARYATPEVPLEVDATVLGGGLGMLGVGVLAATSNDAAQRRLGTIRWRRLHGSVVHVLWLIYFVTYLGRVTDGDAAYWPGLAVVIALPGLRVAARVVRRRSRAGSHPDPTHVAARDHIATRP